jgi:hypothetical protein
MAIALGKELNFTKAAYRLHVTQSALSDRSLRSKQLDSQISHSCSFLAPKRYSELTVDNLPDKLLDDFVPERNPWKRSNGCCLRQQEER